MDSNGELVVITPTAGDDPPKRSNDTFIAVVILIAFALSAIEALPAEAYGNE